jgi:hypothetical protein
MNASSDGRPRYCADAPVAMISASQVYSPASPISRIGFLVQLRGVDVVEHDLGVEALGVLLEARHQFRPCTPFASAGQFPRRSWSSAGRPGRCR